jgi:hypothetical protein
MTENRKQWTAWTITVLLTLTIALFFGVQYPLPEQPEEDLEPIPLAAHFSNPVDIEGSSSAAAPALTFEGDTDTGIFRSAADTLNIATGGTERLEIDASGVNWVPAVTFAGGATLSGGSLDVDTAADLAGNVSSATGAITVTDNVLIDGAADANQLTVQGYTTNTNSLQVWEQSDGTDVATMSNAGTLDIEGNLDVNGTTTLKESVNFYDSSQTVIAAGTELDPSNSSYISVLASMGVTCTIADGTTAGQILVLYNDGTATATIEEASYNADTGGDISLTTDDTVLLLWTGTFWTKIAELVSN